MTAAKTTIDGHEYSVSMLPAKTAKRTLLKIVKVIAPSAADGIGSVSSLAELLGDAAKFGIADAIRTFVDRVDEDTLMEVTDLLAERTTVNLGKQSPQLSQIYDAHFAGKLKAETKWFGFALKTQFADFFDGLGSLEELVARVVVQAPKEQSESRPE